MSTLPALHRSLLEAARRIERQDCTSPSRRRRLVWLRWRQPVILFALLVITGSATAAVVSLNAGRSAPLSGTLPKLHADLHVASLSGAGYRFLLIPDTSVGHAGWCRGITFTARGQRPLGGYGCGPAPPADLHVVMGGSIVVSPDQMFEYAIVDSHVGAMSLDGHVIRPVASPGLPFGWKAAVVIVTFPAPRAGPRRSPPPPPMPQWTPLDRSGRPIPLVTPQGTPVHTRSVSTSNPPAGRCSIHQAHPLAGLHAVAARVEAGAPPRQRPINGSAFTSCAETIFELQGATLTASVLRDSQHSTRRAAALPFASRQPGRRALWNISAGPEAPLQFFEQHPFRFPRLGSITARRVGTVWLAAQGGTRQQRISLLLALTTGH